MTTYLVQTLTSYRVTKTRRFADYVAALNAFEHTKRIDDGCIMLLEVVTTQAMRQTRAIASK